MTQVVEWDTFIHIGEKPDPVPPDELRRIDKPYEFEKQREIIVDIENTALTIKDAEKRKKFVSETLNQLDNKSARSCLEYLTMKIGKMRSMFGDTSCHSKLSREDQRVLTILKCRFSS